MSSTCTSNGALQVSTCRPQRACTNGRKIREGLNLVPMARNGPAEVAGYEPQGLHHTNRQFSDRYACARSLVLIEVIVCGLSMKALHASPVVSTMAVSSLKMRFDRSFDRRDCQTFSTGFNSGDFDGSRMMVRFLATIRLPVLCHPARSINPTACALRAPYLLIPSRCNCMASVLA